MKQTLLWVIGFLIWNSTVWAEDPRVMLVTTEYPPYTGKNMGVLDEIVVRAFQQVGYHVTVKCHPWARALQEVKKGDVDALIGMWYRQEREEWLLFSPPLFANEVGFYKRKDQSIEFQGYEGLKPYRIGTVRGYSYPHAFVQATLTIEEVTTDEQNLQKLNVGRIQLAVIDKGVAIHLIKTNFPEFAETLEWVEPPIDQTPLHLAFSKQAKDYQKKLEDFLRGYQLLVENGTVAKIKEKYGF